MIATIELNDREKKLVCDTLNQAAQKNQESASMTGDKLKKEALESRNKTLMDIAAYFVPGYGKTVITKIG